MCVIEIRGWREGRNGVNGDDGVSEGGGMES